MRLKVGDAFADRESIMHKLHCFKALIAGLFLALAMPVAGMAAASLDMNSVAVGEQYSAEKSEVAKYTDTEDMILNDNLAQVGGYFSRPKLLKLLGGSRRAILTFDDGPHPKTTPLILETLRKRNIKAIFFVLGIQAMKYPEIVRQIHEDGHIIGNHSFSHKNLAQISEEKMREELGRTSEIIEKITGKRPEYLRPPYGAMNRNVLRVANSEGMAIVLWTIDPKDWQNKNELTVLRNIDRQMGISGGDRRGGAILLHDIYPSTVRALEPMLDRLATSEIRMTSIDRLDSTAATFWAAREPNLLRNAAFKREFNPAHTGNHLLITILKEAKKRPEISPMAMLKAHKSGTLLLYLARNS